MDPSVCDRKIYQNAIHFLYFIANNHPNQEQIVINDGYQLSTNTQHAQFIRDFCKGYFSLQCRGPFLCINTQYQCQRVSRNNNSKRLLYHISRDLYFVLFSYSFSQQIGTYTSCSADPSVWITVRCLFGTDSLSQSELICHKFDFIR